MQESNVLRLTKITPALLDATLGLYKEYAPGDIEGAEATLCRGLGYVVCHKSGDPVAVAPLPNIDTLCQSDNSLALTRPVIHPLFRFRGLACILVPIPVTYARLYLPEVESLEMGGSPDINKALSNMGFVELRYEQGWKLPVEHANRSAAELVRLCGTQIARCEGPAGKLAIINQNPGMLLSFDNKSALEELALTGDVVGATSSLEAERSYVFGRSGHCSD